VSDRRVRGVSQVAEGTGVTVASQRIAETVRERILTGQLKPGARIRQDELAGELSSSRLPVREALRILQSGGLVTLKSNRGAWVTSLDQRDCELSRSGRAWSRCCWPRACAGLPVST